MNKYINPRNYVGTCSNRAPFILSPLIRCFEKEKIDHYGNMQLKHEPVFIIGAPRTGSTILYQSLTNLYEILYVDNLVCKFYRNFFFGFWLSNKLYGDRPHNNYRSENGDTAVYGLHAPSECGQFWYRWLPKERHFVDCDEINDAMVDQIRIEIAAIINRFNKPILFKNLNAGQRLRLIQKCFPEAKLLYIKREPFFVVQSILKARAERRIRPNQIWSVKPPNYVSLLSLDETSMIAAQVYYLEKQIEKDLSLFNRKNVFIFSYESMAKDFDSFFSGLEKYLNFEKPNSFENKIVLPDITLKNRVTVDKILAHKIDDAIKKFEWDSDPYEADAACLS